jgi:uncharacterized membrane protein YdbT with pleckstrin-like domain
VVLVKGDRNWPTGMHAAMRYVTRVLQPGETFQYAAKLHRFIYLKAVNEFVICIILVLFSLAVKDNVRIALFIASALFALVAFRSWISAFIRRVTTELVVTDRRVIYKSGLFARHTREMNRSKVESIDVHQPILGRIFGYGTIDVRGTGGSLEPFSFISDPLTFRSHITAD